MGKVDPDELIRLLSEGKTKSECASYFEVSQPAITKWLSKLGTRIEGIRIQKGLSPRSQPQALLSVQTVEVLDENEVNTLQQFRKINEKANRMLDVALTAVENVDVDDIIDEIEKPTKEDFVAAAKIIAANKDAALRSMAEIRQQIKLQLEMFEILYGIKAREEFRQIIIGEIEKESDECASRIRQRLRNKGRLYGVVS